MHLGLQKMKEFNKHLVELQKWTDAKLGDDCPDVEVDLVHHHVNLKKHVHFKAGKVRRLHRDGVVA